VKSRLVIIFNNYYATNQCTENPQLVKVNRDSSPHWNYTHFIDLPQTIKDNTYLFYCNTVNRSQCVLLYVCKGQRFTFTIPKLRETVSKEVREMGVTSFCHLSPPH
jgi:hypothetical protein